MGKVWNAKTKSFDIVNVEEPKKSRKMKKKGEEQDETKELSPEEQFEKAKKTRSKSAEKQPEDEKPVEMEMKRVWNPKTKGFDEVLVPKVEEKKSRKVKSKSKSREREESEATSEQKVKSKSKSREREETEQKEPEMELKKVWNAKERKFEEVMVPVVEKPRAKSAEKKGKKE